MISYNEPKELGATDLSLSKFTSRAHCELVTVQQDTVR